jgi:hypothetical protein
MLKRIALAGVACSAAMALFPGLAAASIAPTLALNQSAGTQGGSSPPTGFDINFNPQSGDSVKNLTIGLPTGFLLNLQTGGGACVAAGGPTPGCQLGSGTINGPSGTPATLYLVAAPSSTDVAGVALVIEGRATVVGGLALTSSGGVGFNLSFTGLAAGISELQFTLSSPRLPTNCGAAKVTVQATSQAGASSSASAALAVTGCSSLPFAPTVSATVTKESGSSSALVAATITQAPGESAPSALSFKVPSDLRVNKVLGPCLEGRPCNVGGISVSSPLLPSSALGSGTLTLGGSLATSTLTMAFPAPYAFSLAGLVSLTERTIKFTGLPDLPLTTMTFTFSGTPAGRAFTTSCGEATINLTLTPQGGGAAHTAKGLINNIGCPPHARRSSRPTASGSLTGLASGKPRLRLLASAAGGGPDITSLSIQLPAGLRLAARALTAGIQCGLAGTPAANSPRHARCAAHRRAKGLSVTGASVKSVSIQGGALRIAFAHSTGRVSLALGRPLMSESKGLEGRARKHKARALVVGVRITDARGASTSLSVA